MHYNAKICEICLKIYNYIMQNKTPCASLDPLKRIFLNYVTLNYR